MAANVIEFEYFNGDILCSRVRANFTTQQVEAVDMPNISILNTVFGENNPTIFALLDFFESRCWDETIGNNRQLLDVVGLQKYDALDIVKRTNGKMSDDNQWIKWIQK